VSGAVLVVLSFTAFGHSGHGVPSVGAVGLLHEMAHALEQSPAVLLAVFVAAAAFAAIGLVRLIRAVGSMRRARGRLAKHSRVPTQRSTVEAR
jgi:hypothetical protein